MIEQLIDTKRVLFEEGGEGMQLSFAHPAQPSTFGSRSIQGSLLAAETIAAPAGCH